MLLETLLQWREFGLLILIGIAIGACYGLFTFIKIILKKNIVISIILDFVFMLLLGFTFFVCLNHVHYGEFRLYLLAGYLLGFYVERKTIGILFAKAYQLLYNKITKIVVASKSTRLSKIIFK